MKNIVGWTLLAVAAITIVLIYYGCKIYQHLEVLQPNHDQLEIYQFDLDIFKTILVGFLVAMLGILIPAYITKSQHDFKRLKESRAAYSKAKTGIDYLALRLCTAKLAEAHDIIHKVHFYKHQAVLYPEFEQHIKDRYDGKISADEWDAVTYRKLRNTRILLKQHAFEWDNLKPEELLKILKEVLPDDDETEKNYDLRKYVLSLNDP